MPPRIIPLQPGCYYHIYNRGTNHQPIFFSPHHWIFFLRTMQKYFRPEWAEVIAYCLMPNHYHILAYVKTEAFSECVMQPFGTSFTKAINHQENRSGPLFEGRFQSIFIDQGNYLLRLSRYIHLNPVHAGLINQPEDWIYSSYRDYIGLRHSSLSKPETVLDSFHSREEYRQFVEEGLNEEDSTIRNFRIE